MTIALLFSSCSKDDTNTPVPTPSAPTITSVDGTKNFPATGSMSRTRFVSGVVAITTAGENKTFDYSTIVTLSPFTYSGANVSNPAFASATATQNIITTFINNDATAEAVVYYSANATSLDNLGIKYNSDTILDFPGVGSVNFIQQNVVNTPAQKLAQFPMMYNQNTTQTVNATTVFTVTSPALPAPNLPAKYNDVSTVTTTNFAWGTLKIPGYNNPMITLVQKTTESQLRNYFLINASGGYDPMPAQLLQAVGITDGATTSYTYYRYWVAGKGFVMQVEQDGSGFINNGL